MKFNSFIIIGFILYFTLTNLSLAKINTNIVVKIGNEIVTNYEIKNKILRTIVLSDQKINQVNINKFKKSSLDALILLKLKKIELLKYDINVSSQRVDNYLRTISPLDIKELKNIFKQNSIDFELLLDEIQTELNWKRFIYEKYSKIINVEDNMIEREFNEKIQSQNQINQFEIYQLAIKKVNDESFSKNIIKVQKEIKLYGFEETIKKYNSSSSGAGDGRLGWIDIESLSQTIYNNIKGLKIGEVSVPIETPDSILFLKINNKRAGIQKKKVDLVKLKKDLIDEKKNELFNLYSTSYLSKLKNTSLIEYK